METLDWAPRGRNTWANVPDIACQDPMGVKSYIIDCRIAWNHTTGGAKGYKKTGHLAIQGEKNKRKKWEKACEEHRDFTKGNTDFIPLSVEITGGWGPTTKCFFDECHCLNGRVKGETWICTHGAAHHLRASGNRHWRPAW